MPWTMDDYPDSLKNLNEVTRKKAIDMANAMVEEQKYEEGRAIAIATAQAEKWYDDASKQEREEYLKEGDPTTHSDDSNKKKSNDSKQGKQSNKKKSGSQSGSNGKALEVISHEDGWAVQQEGKKSPDKTFGKKEEAVDYAKKEAEKKEVEAKIYKENGDLQEQHSYSDEN